MATAAGSHTAVHAARSSLSSSEAWSKPGSGNHVGEESVFSQTCIRKISYANAAIIIKTHLAQ